MRDLGARSSVVSWLWCSSINIRGDAATSGEVLEQNAEINFVLEVSTSHCTRKFWYIDAICNKELVSNSLLAPFSSEFFLDETKQLM